MSTKDVGWDDLFHLRISVATIRIYDLIFHNWEVIIIQSISWTNRDLINHSDKCPRTILKELGSLNLLRISCDSAQ